MNTKYVKPKKTYEEIADKIIQRVKNGELAPGDSLESVEKTAKYYGVSSSTIREALSGLRAMGLVETRHGEGTFITSFDASAFSLPVTTALAMQKKDIKELMAVRRMLEIGTASLAAANHQEEDIKNLEYSLQLMKDAEGEGKLGEQADLQFHLDIANATHNKILINLTSSVSDITLEAMRETRRVILYSEESMPKLYDQHLRILEAIKNRDGALAEKEMGHHLIAVENVLSEYLQ